ncbi:MAG TPA: exodeoxyribonuclease V subunit gamma, partial [Halomonas sp.]|nr:exodeoxyribonuclease V subunit gamma [Halomonas sp.]
VSWVGRSIVDNVEKPPSVLVGQLRDHLKAGWQAQDESVLLDALTTVHPLQPFSRAYFPDARQQAARSIADQRLFTYAHEWHEVHPTKLDPGLEQRQSVTSEDETRQSPPRTRSLQVVNEQFEKGFNAVSSSEVALRPFEQDTPLTLIQLGNFLRDPAKAFFTTRLKVFLDQEGFTSLDQEPFALDGLGNWQLQDLLIQAQRRAVDQGEPREPAMLATLDRLQGQGVLAMGALGSRMREKLIEPMDKLFEAYDEALHEWPHVVDEPEPIRLDVAPNLPVEDWLDELRQDADGNRCRLLLSTSSLIKKHQYHWHHLLRPWVAHLSGQLNGAPLTTRLLSKAGHVTLPPLEPDEARAHLQTLAAAWQAGMRAPLPLAVGAAFVWLSKRGPNDTPADITPDHDAWQAARKHYEGDDFNAGEVSRNPYLAHRWPNFRALVEANRHQPDSFAELSERLLKPVHDAVKGGRDPAT